MNRELQPEPNDELSRRLTRALEAAPAFQLPEGFAVRTAALAAVRFGAISTAPAPKANFATLAVRFAFAACILAMLLLAPYARPHALVPLAVEMLFALEFVSIATWYSLRPEQ